MASASVAIRRILETIALAVIVGGVLYLVREQVQFPLQLLTRAPSFLLNGFCAQQWLFAAIAIRIARGPATWIEDVAGEPPVSETVVTYPRGGAGMKGSRPATDVHLISGANFRERTGPPPLQPAWICVDRHTPVGAL